MKSTKIHCLLRINKKKRNFTNTIPVSMTTMAKVIEEFLHFLAKTVCAKAGGRAPFCKSLVAVWVTEGSNSAWAGRGARAGGPGCCDWRWSRSSGAGPVERECWEECQESWGPCQPP